MSEGQQEDFSEEIKALYATATSKKRAREEEGNNEKIRAFMQEFRTVINGNVNTDSFDYICNVLPLSLLEKLEEKGFKVIRLPLETPPRFRITW